jgi:hypothetical protein
MFYRQLAGFGRRVFVGGIEIMRLFALQLGCAALSLGMLLQAPQNLAQAQLLDQLKGAVGGGGGGLGGALPSVEKASPSNTAGVLQYCVKNNYVSGGAASSVKDSLLSKVTGSGHGTSDSGFKAGSNGLLDTGSGHKATTWVAARARAAA